MIKIPRIIKNHEKAILCVSGIGVVLIAWQLIGERTNKIILPPLSSVLKADYTLFASGMIWPHLEITTIEFLIGLAIAIAIGIPVGLLMGWTRKVNFALDPLLSMTYSIPFIAVIPLIILWFGIGITSKIVTVVFIAIFPIILNTMTGVKRADESLLKVGKSFGASKWNLFSTVVVPGAFPYILSGLRLALGRALVGAIAAELVASTAGLGWLIARYGGTFQTDKMLAVILVVALIGVVSTEVLKKAESHFDAWRTQR